VVYCTHLPAYIKYTINVA